MNNIEKMYENAEVDKMCDTFVHWIQCNWETCHCRDCEHFVYPPFTVEKQIAILQLLTQQCDLTMSHFTKWEFIHYNGQEPTKVTGEDFAETFAKLINAYWQDLTEEEKQQVKGILE